jgi:glycine cleavage system transcriptional repressor
MAQHYLLWSSGEDRPGIVAALTKVLLSLGANLEDSSMMRLGSEFAIFLIFSSKSRILPGRLDSMLGSLRNKRGLAIGVKEISSRQASFRPAARRSFIVSVHGQDRPGIVHRVTDALSRRKFNITDLSTHRTTGGRSPGYILFIEGDLPSSVALPVLRRDLQRLQARLKTKIDIRPVDAEPL